MADESLYCNEKIVFIPPTLKSIAAAKVVEYNLVPGHGCMKRLWQTLGSELVTVKIGTQTYVNIPANQVKKHMRVTPFYTEDAILMG